MTGRSEPSGTTDGGATFPPPVSLTVQPPMWRTGLDGSVVPEVVATSLFSDPASTPLNLLLQTYPDGTPIAGTSAYTASENPTPDESAGTYRLTPLAPLADGWYSIIFDAPAGASVGPAWDGRHGPALRGDGKYESYFRVGSEPLVLSVAACASKDDGLLPKVVLYLSETVTVPEMPPVTVTANGSPASCALNWQTTDWPLLVELTCTPGVPADADISVAVADGFVAVASMAPVKDAAGHSTFTVEIPQASGASRLACRVWDNTGVRPSN